MTHTRNITVKHEFKMDVNTYLLLKTVVYVFAFIALLFITGAYVAGISSELTHYR